MPKLLMLAFPTDDTYCSGSKTFYNLLFGRIAKMGSNMDGEGERDTRVVGPNLYELDLGLD